MLTVIMPDLVTRTILFRSPSASSSFEVGQEGQIRSIPFGEKHKIGNATVFFHPAGHILGSAQVRIEVSGRVVVISGDYKPDGDRTCEEFEPVKCHDFISECTFGLPVYRWKPEELGLDRINQWWSANAGQKKPFLVYAYSLGKAQRVLAGLDSVLVRSCPSRRL